MQITNISEAKASLSQLIQIVRETNQPIIIGKAGKPVAVLSAFKEDTSPRKLGGSWEGKVKIAENFDELDDALVDSFYNSSIFLDKDNNEPAS
jgi:prevent-host-death family protein